MTDRTTLALAACAGLTDAELAQRGPQAFQKMIERKRQYSKAARMLAKGIEMADAKITMLRQQLASLEQLEAPIIDTAQAATMLSAISGKATK